MHVKSSILKLTLVCASLLVVLNAVAARSNKDEIREQKEALTLAKKLLSNKYKLKHEDIEGLSDLTCKLTSVSLSLSLSQPQDSEPIIVMPTPTRKHLRRKFQTAKTLPPISEWPKEQDERQPTEATPSTPEPPSPSPSPPPSPPPQPTTSCKLGNNTHELGVRFNPDLPPNGVQYCVECECVTKTDSNGQPEYKIKCARLDHSCPTPEPCPEGEKLVAPQGKCCKVCQPLKDITPHNQ